jgi:hypothetical protein
MWWNSAGGDHRAERLRLEQERLELERAESKEHMEKLFWEWAQDPEHKAKICRNELMTNKERRAAIRAIYGRPPEPPEVLGNAGQPTESQPDQPSNPVPPKEGR